MEKPMPFYSTFRLYRLLVRLILLAKKSKDSKLLVLETVTASSSPLRAITPMVASMAAISKAATGRIRSVGLPIMIMRYSFYS